MLASIRNVALAATIFQTYAADVSVRIEDTSIAESDGFASIRVVRDGDRETVFSVNYTTVTNGTAVAGVNFLPKSGTLAFGIGELVKTVVIPILNDGVITFGLSFTVELNSEPGFVQITHRVAQVDIGDRQHPSAFDQSFIPNLGGQLVAAAPRADGHLLVAVRGPHGNTLTPSLVLLDPDSVNIQVWPVSFSHIGVFDPWIYSINWLPEGQALVAGYFDHVSGVSRQSLVRLTSEGLVDATFIPSLPDEGVRQAVPLPDGRILVVTEKDLPNDANPTSWTIFRLASDGQLDRTFKALKLTGDRLQIMPDLAGQILLAGNFKVGGNGPSGLARLNSDGSLDARFVPLLRIEPRDQRDAASVSLSDIAVQPDGKILIAGSFTTVNELPRPYIARLNYDGSTDETFEYRPAVSEISSIRVEANGTLLAAGRDGLQRLASYGTRLRVAATRGYATSLAPSKDGMAFVIWTSGDGPLLLRRLFLDNPPRTVVAMFHPWATWSCCEDRFETTEPPDVGEQSISLVRLGDVTRGTSVVLSTRDGTAKAGVDYIPISQTVEFAPFEQEKYVTLNILGDDQFDPEETFELRLEPVTGVEVVAPRATVTIHDGRSYLYPNGIRRLIDGSMEVVFYTPALNDFPVWKDYRLEASSDFRNWSRVLGDPIAETSLGSPRYRMVDLQAGGAAVRFYRLKAL